MTKLATVKPANDNAVQASASAVLADIILAKRFAPKPRRSAWRSVAFNAKAGK